MAESVDDLVAGYQRRTRELAALYETAGDLSALRDVDQVLAAIVRRSRQLLGSDVAYLMLLDDTCRQAYMRVTEGTLTPDFMSIRLAYGEGLGGLVVKTRTPQWTGDYVSDPRFAESIDAIIRAESLTAILGVPLKVAGAVTGVLFASDRRTREFSHDEVALLSSLADHAAIALENAALFEESQRALEKWRVATERIEEHNRLLERAADLHETLTELVLTGASLSAIAEAVAQAIGGRVTVLDADGTPLTGLGAVPPALLDRIVAGAGAGAGGSREFEDAEGTTFRVAPAQAGARRLGYLVHAGRALADTDVRSLERAALVTALLLLDVRAHDEARSRAMADLFAELADAGGPTDDGVRARAAAAGLTLPEPPYVVLAALEAGDPPPRAATPLGKEVTRLALAEGCLARAQGNQVTMILHGSDPAAAASRLAGELRTAVRAPVTVGGDGPFDSLRAATAAAPRALTCAKVLAMVGRVGAAATPEQLGVYTLLFSDAGRDRIEGFVAEVIGPVLAHDAARNGHLAQTLEAYFDVGGQTGRLAETLFIHVNTLYQRLERIDRLLGGGWRRGEQSLQVHLAVRLSRLLRHAM